jgi:hypothetical protein
MFGWGNRLKNEVKVDRAVIISVVLVKEQGKWIRAKKLTDSVRSDDRLAFLIVAGHGTFLGHGLGDETGRDMQARVGPLRQLEDEGRGIVVVWNDLLQFEVPPFCFVNEF